MANRNIRFLTALPLLPVMLAFAQDTTPTGWRRVGTEAPAVASAAAPASAASGGLDAYGNPRDGATAAQAAPPTQLSQPAQAQMAPGRGVPGQLTIRPGTFITVRVNQVLSSDHNQPGDAFSATLARPIVVDGVVVAQRGQTVGGRVAEAVKAGRAKGTSRLGIELTDLSLVDGQQLPLRSQLLARDGGTSAGRDAGAVAATTATGAAIGAAADWGRGAAIGAGAGAAAGIVGVLLTRGRPTEVYPETLLTFRIEAPVTFSTERAPHAFRWVEASDYDRPADLQVRQTLPRPVYYGSPSIYGGPGYWPYYYYGPSFYWGGGYWGGRGYSRGWRR